LAAVNKKYNDLGHAAAEGIKKLQNIESKGRGLTDVQKTQMEQLTEFQIKLEEKRAAELINVLVEANEKDIALEEEQQERPKARIKRMILFFMLCVLCVLKIGFQNGLTRLPLS